MSIGPQIPAHLLARLQQSGDGSSSELEPGPSTENEVHSQEVTDPNAVNGPQLHTAASSTSELKPSSPPQEQGVDDPKAYMPELPPDLLAAREQKRKAKRTEEALLESPAPRRGVLGPAMFPQELRRSDDEEENDDIIGPIPPKGFSATESYEDDRILEFEERAERMRKKLAGEDGEQVEKPQERGEWMLVPPDPKFLGGSLTDTQSRQFSKRGRDPTSLDNSLWTETPAEREKRLLQKGKKRKQDEIPDDQSVKYSRKDEDTKERIKQYNEEFRPKSLLDEHAEKYIKSRKWEEDDVSKRPFDRDRDVVGPRRMDSRKRNEFLRKAKELDSKFSHGKANYL